MIFRKVFSAINTSSSIHCRGASRVRIAATRHQNQVVSVIPIRLYSSPTSHVEDFEGPTVNEAVSYPETEDLSYSEKEDESNFDEAHVETPDIQKDSENADSEKKSNEDAEQVVSLLKKNM